MKNKVLVVILAGSLVCAWGGVGVAGQISYSMRSAEKGFAPKPDPEVPNSSVMARGCPHWPALGTGYHHCRYRGLSGHPAFHSPHLRAATMPPGGWRGGPAAGPLCVPWAGEHPNMRKRASLSLNRPQVGKVDPGGIRIPPGPHGAEGFFLSRRGASTRALARKPLSPAAQQVEQSFPPEEIAPGPCGQKGTIRQGDGAPLAPRPGGLTQNLDQSGQDAQTGADQDDQRQRLYSQEGPDHGQQFYVAATQTAPSRPFFIEPGNPRE